MSLVTHRRSVLLGAASLLLLPTVGRASQGARLVTVGAPVTEIVYALGGGAEVVGTDTTSRYPDDVSRVAKVGYMRTLSAEGLLSLSPTHVLAQEGSGPDHVFTQLRALGVGVTLVPEVPSANGLIAKVRTLSERISRVREGEALTEWLAAQFESLERQRAEAGGLKGGSILCLIHAGNGGPIAAGAGTVADALIRLAGGCNAVAGITDYRPLSVEAAIAAAPEIVLVSHATVAQAGGMDGFLALPQVAQTPAAAARRVVAIDGALLLGLGPRTPDAVRRIASVRVGT
jgi:iron complex transport system substrate-binding protein